MSERQFRTTVIPGLAVRHVVITPNCRMRGNDVAWNDAVERLREAYNACQKTEEEIHVVLTCDWPKWKEKREAEEKNITPL